MNVLMVICPALPLILLEFYMGVMYCIDLFLYIADRQHMCEVKLSKAYCSLDITLSLSAHRTVIHCLKLH